MDQQQWSRRSSVVPLPAVLPCRLVSESGPGYAESRSRTRSCRGHSPRVVPGGTGRSLQAPDCERGWWRTRWADPSRRSRPPHEPACSPAPESPRIRSAPGEGEATGERLHCQRGSGEPNGPGFRGQSHRPALLAAAKLTDCQFRFAALRFMSAPTAAMAQGSNLCGAATARVVANRIPVFVRRALPGLPRFDSDATFTRFFFHTGYRIAEGGRTGSPEALDPVAGAGPLAVATHPFPVIRRTEVWRRKGFHVVQRVQRDLMTAFGAPGPGPGVVRMDDRDGGARENWMAAHDRP